MKQYTDKLFTKWGELIDLVLEEHTNQLKKWDVQTHTLFEWCNYTTEELGELAKAISEEEYREGTKADIVEEAIQVATLALKIAEMCMDG